MEVEKGNGNRGRCDIGQHEAGEHDSCLLAAPGPELTVSDVDKLLLNQTLVHPPLLPCTVAGAVVH